MQDDFSALDLLSIGGFRLSSARAQMPTAKRKRFAIGRPPLGKTPVAARRFTALLPLIGNRLRRPADRRSLQGWPVALSWPTREINNKDLWMDFGDRQRR